MVHARDHTDVQLKYKFAKCLPRGLIEFWCNHWPPVLVSVIRGLKAKNSGKGINGFIIGLPMTARQMLDNRELAQKRVIQAINKAEKLGARIVGLGALTSSVTGGGELIKDKVNIKIISGHAYTAHTVTSYVFKAINEFALDKEKIQIAIVGAAGSIGSTCAYVLSQKGVKKILLMDLERKKDNLRKLILKLKELESRIDVSTSYDVHDIKNADIVIAATNAPETLIRPDDLKPGAIVVDDAQPTDISPEVMRKRKDVMIVDGGVLSAPLKINFNFGLAGKNNIFSCLGEVMIMAVNERFFAYKIGEVEIQTIETISEMGNALDLKIENYQRGGKIYTEQQIGKIKKIIKTNG